ncbi:acyltransferase family protein [Arsenophonus nasoniae]|uniref:Acyltransferase family protein n=1 Tax=Arsenophonus nasoniae TaxID=638 RepID=A0AA95K2F0_9GAMM|nr:acyltransferase family protein [Arsenophonus nasoniae]WGL96886.1 acyltransferase family protein [Arsenophonus nasoniae]
MSGFLIASIVKKSLDNHEFSFREFYRRRMWRLQPALLAVITFTLLAAIIFYLPEDFIDFTRSEKYTTLLLSNQYFSRTTTSYAAQDSNFLLLLQTWSLAIEWQWYLIIPAILYFLHKIKDKNNIIFACITITIISFLITLWSSYHEQNQNYYFLTSRIFEFMIGSTLALSIEKNKKHNTYIINILGIIALVILFYIASYKTILLGYPNYYALIICISTATIIYAGSQGGFIYKILSLPPLVYIGLLSYSLYLWHWPIFATARYIGAFDDIKSKIICYILTIFFSLISYKLIEKPLRKQRLSFFKSLLILIILPIILALLIYGISEKNRGFNFRFGEEYARVDNLLTQHYPVNRKQCFNKENAIDDKQCQIGAISGAKKALLIGDSHANHFWNFFDVIGKNAGVSIKSLSSSSCLALPRIKQYQWIGHNIINTDCEKNTNYYFEKIKTEKFDFIIIAERWSTYADFLVTQQEAGIQNNPKNAIFHALDKALLAIEQSGARPVLVKEVAHMPGQYLNCFYSKVKNRTFHNERSFDKCNFNINQTINNTLWVEDMFKKIQTKHPSVMFIETNNIQCQNSNCLGNIDRVPVYRDNGHLTDYASYKLGLDYIKKIGNPLK